MDGKKPSDIKAIVLSLLVLSPLIIFSIISGIYDDSAIKTPWISWYDDPSNEIYISWETKDSFIGEVRYGTSTEYLESLQELSPNKVHTINITGLIPDTTYYYNVTMDNGKYAIGQFRTAPIINIPFKFGLISDTQQTIGKGWHYRTAKYIDNKNYTFLANVGDLVDSGDEKKYWNDYFKQANIYSDSIPLIPVVGNHDDYQPSYIGTYFKNNLKQGNSELFFSYNWSDVHFQVLYVPYGREHELSAEQIDWLQKDLLNSQDKSFRVTLFHCPIMSAGFFGPNAFLINNLLPILLEYNVSATFHGHAHHFERGIIENSIHPGNDMIYFLLGGGGAASDPGLRPIEETEIITGTPCFTEGDFFDGNLVFRTFTLEGTLIDEYILEGNI